MDKTQDRLKALFLDKVQVREETKDEETLYLASDIARILGVKAVRELGLDEKVITPTGEFLTEDGVQSLLMGSSKPIAQPYQDWMIDVIMAVGRTGKYENKN